MENIFAKFLCKHWRGIFFSILQALFVILIINFYTRTKSDNHIEKTIINIDKKLDKIDNKVAQLAINDSLMNQQLQYYPAAVPTNGSISSRYEVRIDPFTKQPAQHYGIDIKSEKGTPVVATATGMVESTGRKGNYGKQVTIDHFNGYKSTYGHLSEILVKEGQTVVRGDTIGEVGNTGRSTGNHLHYEISYHGKKINPNTFRKEYSEVLNQPSVLYSQL